MASAYESEETCSEQGPPRPTPQAALLRILIVDDSRAVRKALGSIINAHAGWHVCGEATNGAEGISAAARLKPDAVVLDFSMPVMNGIQAAPQIRKWSPATHLLMFSSFANPTIDKAARAAGVEAVIDKSDEAKLLRTLQWLESGEHTGF